MRVHSQSVSSSKRDLKLPLFLFLAILGAKIAYVIVESFYNYHVFMTTTSADMTRETLENLNQDGHIISAFGITLLLVPFAFFIIRKFLSKYLYVAMLFSSLVIYAAAYNSLEYAIEKIVESNKDTRHDAYYVNGFKFGLLNNLFTYDSFVESTKILSNNLDVNDRIRLTNIFLLLHADKELIDKLKERGKEKVSEFYIDTQKKDDYESKYGEFEKASKEVGDAWNEFNDKRKELREGIAKIDNMLTEASIKKAHRDFINGMQSKYKEYRNGWQNADKKIAEATAPSELKNSKEELQKYFRYQNHSKAQQQYKSSMHSQFGHYVEPKRWLDYNGNVTEAQVKKVITEEIIKKASNSIGIQRGLSEREFANDVDVKIGVAKEFKNKGITIPFDFNYTFESFKKYYVIPLIKKNNEAESDFYKKLEEKIGKNDLKLNMEWEDFVRSKYISDKMSSRLKELDKADKEKIIQAIISKDLGNFRKMIYLPKVVGEVDKKIYAPRDFEDGGRAVEDGDEAIKLLYVPPFALSISILALLLNFITVLGMLLELITKLSSAKILLVKSALACLIVFIPVQGSNQLLQNDLLSKLESQKLERYVGFLEWLSYYQNMNAKVHSRGS